MTSLILVLAISAALCIFGWVLCAIAEWVASHGKQIMCGIGFVCIVAIAITVTHVWFYKMPVIFSHVDSASKSIVGFATEKVGDGR